jgi:transcriptional regulator with XRE-family HTH domain
MNATRRTAINNSFDVASRICRLRRDHRISQFDLAAICDVKPAQVSDWESAVTMPGALDCLTLAELSTQQRDINFWIALSGFSDQQIAMLCSLANVLERRAA